MRELLPTSPNDVGTRSSQRLPRSAYCSLRSGVSKRNARTTLHPHIGQLSSLDGVPMIQYANEKWILRVGGKIISNMVAFTNMLQESAKLPRIINIDIP